MPYFNEFKYKLPKQCSGPADAPYIRQEHDDFIKFTGGLSAVYNDLAAAERRQGEALMDKESEKVRQKVMQALRTGVTLDAPPSIR